MMLKNREEGKRHFEDKPYMERKVPAYLSQDIQRLIQARRGNSLIDCYEAEVYGSINSALYDGEITDEQAIYLRWKYLHMLPSDVEEI